MLTNSRCFRVFERFGGRERIRTSGTVTRTPDFESGAFNHSATLPLNDLHRQILMFGYCPS